MVKRLRDSGPIAFLVVVILLLSLTLPAATTSSSAQPVSDRVIRERGSVSSGAKYRLTNGTEATMGTSRGGDYQLTEAAGGAAQISSGGAYRLLHIGEAPEGSENGCCCIYLPCVIKDD